MTDLDLPADGGPSEIDLVLFEVAGRTFGADVANVSRVSISEPGLRRVERLGTPRREKRALVVRGQGGEALVPIDRLVGFRRIGASALRKLPQYATGLAEPAVVGFLSEQGELLVLLDLLKLVDEERPAPEAAGARSLAGA